jgi:hypothetical protein
MSDQSHACSSDIVGDAPGGSARRIFMCVGHLVWSVVAGLALMGVLAVFAGHP